MIRLTQFALREKSVMILLAVGVFLAGLYSWGQLRQELIPDIELPFVTVITPLPGAGAEDVAEPGHGAHRARHGQRPAPRDHAVDVVQLALARLRPVRLRHRPQGDHRQRRGCRRPRPSCPRAVEPQVSSFDFSSQPIIVATVGPVEGADPDRGGRHHPRRGGARAARHRGRLHGRADRRRHAHPRHRPRPGQDGRVRHLAPAGPGHPLRQPDHHPLGLHRRGQPAVARLDGAPLHLHRGAREPDRRRQRASRERWRRLRHARGSRRSARRGSRGGCRRAAASAGSRRQPGSGRQPGAGLDDGSEGGLVQLPDLEPARRGPGRHPHARHAGADRHHRGARRQRQRLCPHGRPALAHGEHHEALRRQHHQRGGRGRGRLRGRPRAARRRRRHRRHPGPVAVHPRVADRASSRRGCWAPSSRSSSSTSSCAAPARRWSRPSASRCPSSWPSPSSAWPACPSTS